jgi:hypothetical protein
MQKQYTGVYTAGDVFLLPIRYWLADCQILLMALFRGIKACLAHVVPLTKCLSLQAEADLLCLLSLIVWQSLSNDLHIPNITCELFQIQIFKLMTPYFMSIIHVPV